MPPKARDLLASLLGESRSVDQEPQPVLAKGAAGPWRVTAKASGGRLQISNRHESRLIPKAQLDTYLRMGAKS